MSSPGRALAAIASGALLVLLAGCFALPPAPTPAPSASVSATPVAVDTCERWLDPEKAATALGTAPASAVHTDNVFVAAVGGVQCTYEFGTPPSSESDDRYADDGGSVSLTVAPSAITEPDVLHASLTSVRCIESDEYFGVGCSATATTSGWWYTLQVYTPGSAESQRAGFEKITSILEKTLANVSAPTHFNITKAFDCQAADTGSVRLRDSRGDSDHYREEISEAAYLLARPTTCVSDEPDAYLTVYPGSAAAYEQCVGDSHGTDIGPGASADVPGVQSVVVFPGSEGYGFACATDGRSTVEVQAMYSGTWDKTSIDSMRSLVVPVLASADRSASPFVPTQIDSAAPSTAAPLAGGDCRQLLDTGHLATAIGMPADAKVISSDRLLAILGGLHCEYLFGGHTFGAGSYDGKPFGYVSVSVVPSAIANPGELETTLISPSCEGEGEECRVIATVDGWWYALSVSSDQATVELPAAFASIRANLEQKLQTAEAPKRIKAVPPFDCTSTASKDLARAASRNYSGSDIYAAAVLLAGPTTCTYWTEEGGYWDVTVYPGAAAAFAACRTDESWDGRRASAIAIDGVPSALTLTYGGYGSTLCTTDGTSLIEASNEGEVEWNAATLARLSSLLVPVFAAAK